MKIALRVDASLDIGIGHVMRCLTLADALREQGASCAFVCREFPGNLIDMIRQRNYQVHPLPAVGPRAALTDAADDDAPLAHAAWLGAGWRDDVRQTQDALDDALFDWLVIDHYGIDARWERSLRPLCSGLMVIDDITDRKHDCDILLNQNLGRSAADYDGLTPAGCHVCAGPKYALLRPEFAALRPYSLARRAMPRLDNLLITMGGVDKDNATGMVLDALRACPLPAACRISVVMGPHAPWLDQIRRQAADMPWATEVMVNVVNMAELMADSDLAIGAAGTTAWERCCLALPTLAIVLADNQRDGARALSKTGAALLLSNGEQLATDLRGKFSRLLNHGMLEQMRQACAAVTDGNGATYIASLITKTNG